jgi:hypothetical protein
MDENSIFCEECGTKYESMLSEVKDTQTRHPCNSCKKEVSPEAAFCPHCGIKNPLLGIDASRSGRGHEMKNQVNEENLAGNALIKYLGIGFLVVVVAVLFIASTNKDSVVSDKSKNKAQNPPAPKIEQPPPPPPQQPISLKVSTSRKFSGGSWGNYLNIQALNQSIVVQKVTVNRGGCQIMNQSFGVNLNGPLKFGDTLTYFIMPYPDCHVAEVEVTTNLGKMTYNFD